MEKRYIIRDREAGNVICSFSNIEEAIKCYHTFEQDDIDEGTYTEDFYELYDSEAETSIYVVSEVTAETITPYHESFPEGMCKVKNLFDKYDKLRIINLWGGEYTYESEFDHDDDGNLERDHFEITGLSLDKTTVVIKILD